MTHAATDADSIDVAESTLTRSLRASVRALYERRPYPHYPLLAKPRWQEGWISHSLLSKALAASKTGRVSGGTPRRILIAGCGEILPAVICANEPAAHRIDAVDLSRRSLRRAYFRCMSELRRLRLRRADAETWFAAHQSYYDHIDCYGVLHHMPDPLRALTALASSLKPGGTARVMVYNSPARSWIHEWQAVFRALRLTPTSNNDVGAAMRLLKTAGSHSPALSDLLARMGPSLLTSKTRFADTFLHPREARLGPEAWIKAVENAGMTITGLHDRYEECDDAPNPLWGINTDDLCQRVRDGLFEGNLEFFVQKDGGVAAKQPALTAKHLRLPAWFFAFLSPPPLAWWQTNETHAIAPRWRRHLWHKHREHIMHGGGQFTESDLTALSALYPRALQRLARLGAVLPGQLPRAMRADAAKPLGIPEEIQRTTSHHRPQVPAAVLQYAHALGTAAGLSERRLQAMTARLRRAVHPA